MPELPSLATKVAVPWISMKGDFAAKSDIKAQARNGDPKAAASSAMPLSICHIEIVLVCTN
jgi:hypothetical protein